MAIPTDRGIVVITDESDGSQTVAIGAGVDDDGAPIDVYAKHVRVPRLVIDPAVRLVDTGLTRHSTRIVEVFHDASTGSVHIRPTNATPSLA